MKDRYRYDDSHHNWKSHDFRIMALEMRNTGLECASKFTLKLEAKATKEWNNVFFRFEITVMNAIKVATMFSDKGVDFKQDEDKKIAFLIDTAHLTPAKYRVDIVAYVTDKFGEDHFLDGVYPGFFFEITDRINEHNSKVWHQQYWGAIHLQDAKILNE